MTNTIKKIGWVGTGVMGAPMCGHLLKAGHSIWLFSRTKSKAEPLLSSGATWCDTPSQVANQSDIIFTMVGSPEEVREVYFSETGLIKSLRKGAVVIDMGTTPPSLSGEIAKEVTKLGGHAIDAPVSGGDIGAMNATLTIMAGGEASVVDSIKPLFDQLGKTLMYMGASGSGQHTKMCNQMAVAGTMIGMCEALVYADRAGLDCEQLLLAIQPGAAGSWALQNLAPRILQQDDSPGFMVDHFIKDLGIAIKEAKRLGLELPGLELAERLYKETNKIGHGLSGTQALIHALRHLNKQ